MITRVSGPQVWQRWKAAKRLAVLTAFEGSVTGMRVKEFCQGLSRKLGRQCQIAEHVWLFSTFRQRELQEIAAEDASGADLIVIAAHRAEGLPDEVKSWIELWLRGRGSRRAVLVALLDPAYEGASGSTEAYLQEVARRGGMELVGESADVAASL
jgi:hypothetical protein